MKVLHWLLALDACIETKAGAKTFVTTDNPRMVLEKTRRGYVGRA